MEVKFYCTRWGAQHIPWEQFLDSVKSAGYAGVEWFPFGEKTDYWHVVNLLNERGLEFSIVMTVVDEPQDFQLYTTALENQLFSLSAIRSKHLAPLFITAQTGREFFTAEQVETCLAVCKKVSDKTGIPVYQETHRNKWTYAAYKVLPFLQKKSDLFLTLDISHWFCVSESYLHDQQAAVNLAILQTRHLHARVGHTQGSQVDDPAAAGYQEALNEHLKIWDKWVHLRRIQGDTSCTITPEFGPPPYMTCVNNKVNPFDKQWRLNLWMKRVLEDRYKE
jgi:sugar phosphate isomerase/epimerase